jgi:glutathione S-transferase
MKLYMHPVSMTSRPVRLFIAEKKIPCEEQIVDLMTGEHLQEPFAAINPNKLVPVLEDDGVRLTESSAILKYLAEKQNLPEYPKDLKARAKVNELMDWFNTNFYRDWAYGMAYPQIFPNHKRASEEVQAGTIAWGAERSRNWLTVLDKHWLGSNNYVCGKDITVADYFGVCLVTLGEILRVDFTPFPNVQRWIGNMKKLESWARINEQLYGFANAVKDAPFITV